jgi:molybdopterin synthase catalytic subunit
MTTHSIVRLVDDPIVIADWVDLIADVDTGAHTWFAGITRRKTKTASGEIKITKLLFYEAHPSMAIKQMEQIAERAGRQFKLSKIVIVHRLGEVPLGEASVLVGCSSPHRADAYAANAWIMDRLKEDVPIWKRETFEDESSEWIHPS